jgi:hypothetical protein
MTSVMVDLTEHNNWIVNMLKAKFSLKNKSDAMNFLVQRYEKEALEPEVRPEYIKKANKIHKEKGKSFDSLQEMLEEMK